jgi:hypothetical protein
LSLVLRFNSNSTDLKHYRINTSTVRKHLGIYSKFVVHSWTEVIAQALAKLGILNSPPLV